MYKVWGFLTLAGAILTTAFRRLIRGPKRTGWSWTLEATTIFRRRQHRRAASFEDPDAARRYLDSFVIASSAGPRVRIEPDVIGGVEGRWFRPQDLAWNPEPGRELGSAHAVHRTGVRRPVVYHLQGGGFTCLPRGNEKLVSWIALTSRVDVFAPSYRLAPEHPFPAAFEDAMKGYQGLLERGEDPRAIVIMGDSSGGGLALALLQAIRDAELPSPALSVLLSPWLDLTCTGESVWVNGYFDWLDLSVVKRWAESYAGPADLAQPRLSPLFGSLHGLPPIYVQAGSADLFISQVRELERRARAASADFTLDVWANMNHTFQMYGDVLEQSREALGRIRARVDAYVRPTPVAEGVRLGQQALVSPAPRARIS